MCEKYLITNHKDDITRILKNPEKEKYFAVNINFLELFETATNLGNELLTEPEVSLKNWNKAVFNVQSDLLKEIDAKYTFKNNVSCRIYSLPPWAHICRTVFPGNNDANKFLQVTGTVVRMSARKLLECRRQYICIKCKYPIIVEAQYDKRNIIKQPKKCSNPDGCASKNIIPCGELDTYNCKDYQEIKIQEDLSKLGVATIPNHMIVTLEDDLVNICKPGENVTITGIVTRRWSEFDKGIKVIIDIVLRANHVQVNNSSGLSIAVSDDMKQFFDGFWERHINEPLIGRNIILRSIAPEIYGLHLVKLAIAIVLAGGSQSEDNEMCTGIDKRPESHLLLVGDPGTGKSQMLRFASKIIPRSVLTTGVGSTAAGLTVTAVMENGEWQLEAGALVMSDGGICCIDEFNSMREHDRTSIHEAMEQQTISVAKAGMVCKLKTRCSILAACNPKGNINLAQPLCVNVAMSTPLLSRFDLILLLRDVVNQDNDARLAEYVLNKRFKLSDDGSLWNIEKLQAYFAVIKKQNPKLTVEAETILSTYYQLQRKFSSRNKSRTTVRLLESIIRLSQGHAKLLYHDEVEVIDAIFAVMLTDTAMDFESSLLNLKVDDNAFFDHAEELYWELFEKILGKLNLDYIYQKEIEKIGIENIRARINQPNDGTSPDKSQNQVATRGVFSQETAGKLPQPLFSQRHKQVDKSQQNTSDEDDLSNVNKKRCFGLFTQRRQYSNEETVSENHINLDRPSTSKDSTWSRSIGISHKSPVDKGKKRRANSPKTYKNELKKINKGQYSNAETVSENHINLDRPSTSKDSTWSRSIGISHKSPVDKGKKRRANSPKTDKNELKKINKEPVENEMDLLKQMPSVNDDFARYELAVDWDLEGEDRKESSGSSSNLSKSQKRSQHSHDLLSSNKTGNVRDSSAKEESKARSSLFSKFLFQPREKEKVDFGEIQRSSESKSVHVETQKVSPKVGRRKETDNASQNSRFKDADHLEILSFNSQKDNPKGKGKDGSTKIEHVKGVNKESSSSCSLESKLGNAEDQKVSCKALQWKRGDNASQKSRFKDIDLNADYLEILSFNSQKDKPEEKGKDDSTKIKHAKEVNRNKEELTKESSSSTSLESELGNAEDQNVSRKALQWKRTDNASQKSRFSDIDLDADYLEILSFNSQKNKPKEKGKDDSTKIKHAKEVNCNKEELTKESSSSSSSESKSGCVEAKKVTRKAIQRKETGNALQISRFKNIDLDAEYSELFGFKAFAQKGQSKKESDDSSKIEHAKEVNCNKEELTKDSSSSSSSSESSNVEAQKNSHKAIQIKEIDNVSQTSHFGDIDLDAEHLELLSCKSFTEQPEKKENDDFTKIDCEKEIREELSKKCSKSNLHFKSGNVEAQKDSHKVASQKSRFRDIDLDADYLELLNINSFCKKGEPKEKTNDESTKMERAIELDCNKEKLYKESSNSGGSQFKSSNAAANNASQTSRFTDIDLDAEHFELLSFNPSGKKGQSNDKENDDSTKIQNAKEVNCNQEKSTKENSSSSESKSSNVEDQRVSHKNFQRNETDKASKKSRFKDIDLDAEYLELLSFINPHAKK